MQDELTLESPDVTRRAPRAGYRHGLAHYAAEWGLTSGDATRTLKRWIADGRRAVPPDFPPFDQPALLAAWWRRHKKWRVPDWMLQLEASAPPPSTPSASPASAAVASVADTSLPRLASMRVEVDAAADMGVKIFLALVNDTIRRINEAATLGNHREYNRLQKELAGQLEALRKQEAAAIKVAEGKGEILRTRNLVGEVSAIFSVATLSFENAMLGLAEELAPDLPPPERRSRIAKFRDACIRHLRNTRFASAWEGMQAPAAA